MHGTQTIDKVNERAREERLEQHQTHLGLQGRWLQLVEKEARCSPCRPRSARLPRVPHHPPQGSATQVRWLREEVPPFQS